MATGTLTNRILDPSGTAVPNVVVNARLMPGSSGFTPTPFYEITQLKSTTSDSNGDWTLTLEINTDITPGDSYYEIEELIPGANGVPVIHAVQVASGSHTLMASLVSTPPTTAAPSYITQSSGDARYAPLGGGGGAATIGVNIQPVGTATVTGTATTVASSGHAHALSPAVVGWGLNLVAGVLSVNSNSMTTTVTIPTVGATPTVITTQTVTGTATQYAPSNHGHVLGPQVAGDDITVLAGVVSVNPRVPLVGAIPRVITTNTITGTSTAYAPANHGHVLGAVVAGNDIAITDGTINVTPRVPTTAGLVQPVGTATITGTATTYAVGNHQHPLSPAVVGTGLTLTAGVINVTAPFVVGGETQPTNTGTVTGTATIAAPANHQHALGPTTVGSGLAIQTAQYVAANLTNSNAAASFLYTITSTNSSTATVAVGQVRFDTASLTVNVQTASQNQVSITPLAAAVAGTCTTTQTAYIAGKPTTGPTVTVLTGTQVMVFFSAQVNNSSANGYAFMAVAVSGATTLAAADGNGARFQAYTGSADGQITGALLLTGLTAGLNTFSVQYRALTGTANFSVRNLIILPVP